VGSNIGQIFIAGSCDESFWMKCIHANGCKGVQLRKNLFYPKNEAQFSCQHFSKFSGCVILSLRCFCVGMSGSVFEFSRTFEKCNLEVKTNFLPDAHV
jgi:hypothetical protein